MRINISEHIRAIVREELAKEAADPVYRAIAQKVRDELIYGRERSQEGRNAETELRLAPGKHYLTKNGQVIGPFYCVPQEGDAPTWIRNVFNWYLPKSDNPHILDSDRRYNGYGQFNGSLLPSRDDVICLAKDVYIGSQNFNGWVKGRP